MCHAVFKQHALYNCTVPFTVLTRVSSKYIFFCISQTCFAEFRVFSQVAKTVRICAKKKQKKIFTNFTKFLLFYEAINFRKNHFSILLEQGRALQSTKCEKNYLNRFVYETFFKFQNKSLFSGLSNVFYY